MEAVSCNISLYTTVHLNSCWGFELCYFVTINDIGMDEIRNERETLKIRTCVSSFYQYERSASHCPCLVSIKFLPRPSVFLWTPLALAFFVSNCPRRLFRYCTPSGLCNIIDKSLVKSWRAKVSNLLFKHTVLDIANDFRLSNNLICGTHTIGESLGPVSIVELLTIYWKPGNDLDLNGGGKNISQ
jgi:hypothetical protein